MHEALLVSEKCSSTAVAVPVSLGRMTIVAETEQPAVDQVWQERLTNQIAQSSYVDELLGSPKQFRNNRSHFSRLIPGTANQLAMSEALGAVTSRAVEIMDLHRREWDFFQKVYSFGKRIAEGNEDPIVLMFDVDQTIADNGKSGKLVVRPAFPLVIAALRQEFGDRLQVGILTTRNETTDRDIILADIEEDAIANNLVIGTQQYGRDNPHLMVEELGKSGVIPEELVLEQLEDLLRPDVIAAIRDGKLNIDSLRDSDGKLEILRDLQFKYPNTRFGFIDNLPSAGVIRADNEYISGLWVGHEVQDDILAIQRVLLPKLLAKAGLAMAA